MTANFKDILSQQVDSVERPKLFPKGNYRAVVVSHEYLESSKKQTPFVRFWTKLVSPMPIDDDYEAEKSAEAFEAAGGMEKLGERKPIRNDYYLTGDAMYRLREYLEDTLELNCAGRPFDEVIPDTTNCQLIVSIIHNPGSKEGEFWMEIDSTASINATSDDDD